MKDKLFSFPVRFYTRLHSVLFLALFIYHWQVSIVSRIENVMTFFLFSNWTWVNILPLLIKSIIINSVLFAEKDWRNISRWYGANRVALIIIIILRGKKFVAVSFSYCNKCFPISVFTTKKKWTKNEWDACLCTWNLILKSRFWPRKMILASLYFFFLHSTTEKSYMFSPVCTFTRCNVSCNLLFIHTISSS